MRHEMFPGQGAAGQTDLREAAVRLILTGQVTRTRLARDLGVGLPTLSRWLRQTFDESPYGDILASLHDQVALLHKENAALRKTLAARRGQAVPKRGLRAMETPEGPGGA